MDILDKKMLRKTQDFSDMRSKQPDAGSNDPDVTSSQNADDDVTQPDNSHLVRFGPGSNYRDFSDEELELEDVDDPGTRPSSVQLQSASSRPISAQTDAPVRNEASSRPVSAQTDALRNNASSRPVSAQSDALRNNASSRSVSRQTDAQPSNAFSRPFSGQSNVQESNAQESNAPSRSVSRQSYGQRKDDAFIPDSVHGSAQYSNAFCRTSSAVSSNAQNGATSRPLSRQSNATACSVSPTTLTSTEAKQYQEN